MPFVANMSHDVVHVFDTECGLKQLCWACPDCKLATMCCQEKMDFKLETYAASLGVFLFYFECLAKVWQGEVSGLLKCNFGLGSSVSMST